MRKLALYGMLALALFGLPFMAYTSEEYVGAQKCKICHIKIFKSWSETRHAKAFEVLAPGVAAEAKKKAKLDPQKDYTVDPACIACHTTGKTSMFPGVQCEACHAAGRDYTSAKIMNKKKYAENRELQHKLALEAGLVIKPEESLCKTCHNEKSPTFKPFDFAERCQQVTHQEE